MTTNSNSEFDAYSKEYDEALHRGVSLSGERKEYFAEARVAWLKRQLGVAATDLPSLMDYGCGVGSGVPALQSILQPREILGIDVSQDSLKIARKDHGSAQVKFFHPRDYAPRDRVNLVFSNGTFHHIPPAERAGVLTYIQRALVPGGWIAIWENNPWNPGTRMVMQRIPFDRDAITISAPALARLVRASGLKVRRVDFLFIFPRVLSALRGLEPFVCKLPLGAQYMVLAQKPTT